MISKPLSLVAHSLSLFALYLLLHFLFLSTNRVVFSISCLCEINFMITQYRTSILLAIVRGQIRMFARLARVICENTNTKIDSTSLLSPSLSSIEVQSVTKPSIMFPQVVAIESPHFKTSSLIPTPPLLLLLLFLAFRFKASLISPISIEHLTLTYSNLVEFGFLETIEPA